MNLPFFKRFNKKVLPLYYLVLVLRDEKVQAVIFEELEGIAKIIGQREEHLSASIDDISQEDLLEKLDKAISSAESSLPENIQTQKTIFGVKDSWTENDQIKKEYLTKLKKTSEELGLVPIGFLVISQAIAHLLQKEEGAPVSAILCEINKMSLTVTLLRAGKTIETKSSEIHESIPFTVDTLLKHFNVPEILPSRIIIFNGNEDFSQDFISHTWSKSLPFLHLPQITNLPQGFDARAVLFGAATQMGFVVSHKDIPLEPSIEPLEEVIQTKTNQPDITDHESNEEETLAEEPKLYKNLEAGDFGFVQDVDVAEMPASPQGKPAPQEPQHLEEKTERTQIKIPQINKDDDYTVPNPPKRSRNALTSVKNILVKLLNLVFTVVRKIDLKKISFLIPKGNFGIIISAMLILIIGSIASYFLFLKATITILIDPKISEQNKSVVFSTTQTTDPGNNIIRGEFVTISEDGSVSTAATGKKDVGTSAKGAVTIFNSSSETVNISAGTKIISSNNLEFTLDNSINLASASSSVDQSTLVRTIKPSSETVNVTANQLGKESNLPSGSKFTVGNFDNTDVLAKNDNPFSGGTKKTVTVVSKDDSGKLTSDLIKQLKNDAKEDLQKQLGQNKILLPIFIAEDLGQNSLNAKVGDEVNQVTLTGTVEYKGIAYEKSDMITFSKSLLSKDVPSNQVVDYNNIKTDVLDIKTIDDEEVQANLDLKSLLLPKIDENKLTTGLKGKSFKEAESIIYRMSQVANVSIKLSPNLPFLPKTLPVREKNIKILTKING